MAKFTRILFVLVLGLFINTSFVYAAVSGSEYKVGKYQVYVLPEDNLAANIGILKNAQDEDIDKLFPSKNFPMYLKTFIIRGPKHTVLVDAGFGTQLFAHLKNLNIDPKDIDTVLLTHLHGDHIGGLLQKDIIAFPNADVFVAKKELEYWTDKEIQAALPKVKQSGFAKAQRVIDAYGSKIKTFDPVGLMVSADIPHYSPDKEGKEVLDGIRALAAYGHTPGHTAFFVGHGEDALLIWGDIVHVQSIQMPKPEVSVVFDVDSDMARKTRLELLDFVSKNKIKVAGMHLDGSGALLVKKADKGYSFEAVTK